MPKKDNGKNFVRDLRTRMAREVEEESLTLVNDPGMDAPLPEQKKRIRTMLQNHGTNVELNDRDPMGDGDQSPITLAFAEKQKYRDLYAQGGFWSFLVHFHLQLL